MQRMVSITPSIRSRYKHDLNWFNMEVKHTYYFGIEQSQSFD